MPGRPPPERQTPPPLTPFQVALVGIAGLALGLHVLLWIQGPFL
jgi:hypothetical protein